MGEGFFYFLGGWGESTNERPGNDHVISGPMRGLEKKTASDGANTQTHKQTDGHHNSITKSAQWGRFSENYDKESIYYQTFAFFPSIKPFLFFCVNGRHTTYPEKLIF